MVSKSEAVYEALRHRIVSAQVKPASRLVLDSLAKEFGVSPVPVREAIRRLEAEGLVKFTQNVGATVCSISFDEFSNVMETFAIFHGSVVAKASSHISMDNLRKARILLEEIRVQERTFEPNTLTTLLDQFDDILAARCPNAYLRDQALRCIERMRMIRSTYLIVTADQLADIIAHYAALLRMVEQSAEPQEIELLVRGFILHRLELARAARNA